MGAEDWEGMGAFIIWVDAGGGACSNMYVLNLKASFLPVETSTCSLNHTKVVSPKLQHSTWMDNPVCCSGSWAPPLPYVHLVSTLYPPCIHLAPDVIQCFQAFPILTFRQSPTLMYYCERKWKVNREGLEMRLYETVSWSIFSQIRRSGMYHSRPM